VRQFILELEFNLELGRNVHPGQHVNVVIGAGVERFGVGIYQRLLGDGRAEVAGRVG
jgi:hypothetical protein